VVAVFDELSRGLGVPADTLWTALFPGRRAARPAGVKRLVDEGE
jgi:hypothetical protein